VLVADKATQVNEVVIDERLMLLFVAVVGSSLEPQAARRRRGYLAKVRRLQHIAVLLLD